MKKRIDHFVEIIETPMNEDPKKDFTMTAFYSAVSDLNNLIETRHEFLMDHQEVSEIGPEFISVSVTNQPTPFEETIITASINPNENDGVSSVYLYYTPNGQIDPYQITQMFDDGKSGDENPNDGIYGASIPGYPSGEKVWFYIEARSGNSSKTATFYPSMAESNPSSFRVKSMISENESPVIINEFMASNTNSFKDPQGDYDDWIELLNTTENKIDLSGWHLSDNKENPRKWQFPEGTSIAANEYLLVWADENGSAAEGLHANFKLSSKGEFLSLTSPDEQGNLIMDMITFGTQSKDISFGRISKKDETFHPMTPTPGTSN